MTETKPYRLMKGRHDVPNPDWRPGSTAPSHKSAQVGDIMQLTDDQYRAFHDKFRPVDSSGTDVKDADQERLRQAQERAFLTGEHTNPNASIPTPSEEDLEREREANRAANRQPS